jgi:xanthine dehydrogenase accessory factor
LDDDYGWDDGLICGGRMQVLADPICARDGLGYFESFCRLVEAGAGCTEAVVIDPSRFQIESPGARALFGPTGALAAQRRWPELPSELPGWVPDLARRPRPITREGIAFLPILPRCRLLIVGAGHVGQAVAQLAAQADFDIWIMDDRERYANQTRFPSAERILVGDLGATLAQLELDQQTYCLIVTRGHAHDEEALYHLAGSPARYVGMIGSKRKIRLIFDDLAAEGIAPEALERVHAPVGLHIGSQTVPEIAVSIVAELIAQRNLGQSAEKAHHTSAQPLK